MWCHELDVVAFVGMLAMGMLQLATNGAADWPTLIVLRLAATQDWDLSSWGQGVLLLKLSLDLSFEPVDLAAANSVRCNFTRPWPSQGSRFTIHDSRHDSREDADHTNHVHAE